MDAESAGRLAVSLALLMGNAFFVMAEYALVSCKKNQIEALARRGNRLAKQVADALNNVSIYVAGTQVAITLFSIGIGSVTEPWVTKVLTKLFGVQVPFAISILLSYFFLTYLTVVLGELVPKYITLNTPNRVAMATIVPLRFFTTLLMPLVWLSQRSGSLAVRPLGINLAKLGGQSLPKEELLLLVRAGTSEGLLDKVHADILSRAVRIDKLMARDVMVHRLDIQWIDLSTSREELLPLLSGIPHSRIPVCRGDIDDVAGIVYLHHIVKGLQNREFTLEQALRPAEIVPENLTLDRIVQRMRETRTQMLIVSDEYGGTSGLITLEDVVEEVFGDLEDRLESERSPIEVFAGGRVSARSDVRFDELVAKLGAEMDEPSTDTLANMIVTELERVPKLGDSVTTPLGVLRIENMARHRITRVSLQLANEWASLAEPELEAR